MEINDFDDLLREFEIEGSISTQPQQQENTEEASSEDTTVESPFSEEDISAIIADNESDEDENEEESLAEEEEISHDDNAEIQEDSSVQEEEERGKLPPNSPTLLIDESTARFSGAEWFKKIQEARVIVAGIGGIGSNFCFQLARMAPASMVLYDNDTVEKVNMAGQLFSVEDVGKYKVDAITSMIKKYTTMTNIMSVSRRFDHTTEAGDIMVCGFDNMLARRKFFNAWLLYVSDKPVEKRQNCLYLDGRLSMTNLQVLCIRGDDTYNITRYQREFLFSDSQADATVCSMKQTTYLACMIGSLMVNLFTNFIANSLNPVIPYDMPFFTEYDAQNMIFKTEN